MARSWGLLLVAIVGALIGLAGGWFWRAGSAATPASAPARPQGPSTATDLTGDTLQRQLDGLREMLGAEVEARAQLEQEVEQLREELRRIRLGSLPGGPSPERAPFPSKSDTAATQARPTFDEEALLTVGVPADEASWLHRRFDEFELERLELLDQARREGWAKDPSYRQERRALKLGLREEIGEELYDRLLYALGRSNRLAVRDVLMRSPAEEAGIEPGDLILTYDDARVFDVFELRGATSAGRRGESVPIEVIRRGRRLRIIVPRGPLGVKLQPERVPPLEGS